MRNIYSSKSCIIVFVSLNSDCDSGRRGMDITQGWLNDFVSYFEKRVVQKTVALWCREARFCYYPYLEIMLSHTIRGY